MASTYVNDLRLNEMATGDASGSWGTVTNTNLELIGEAFSYGTETIGDADSTLTIADGAADAARSFYLKITSSVDLTTTRIVTLGPNTVSKVWMIENATTGSQVITIKQGSGATINVPNGQVKMISTDGAGSGGAVLDLLVDVDLTGTTTLVNLDVSGAVDIAGDLTLSAGGDGALRFTAASSVKVLDNDAAALVFEEADNAYMTFVTTDGSEAVKFDKALDINAATQIDATVTVGVDDTGYDVKFFGATAGAYMLWDESADDLILAGAGGLVVAGNVDFNGDLDVDGTTNLDVVDIDDTLNVAGVSTFTAAINQTTESPSINLTDSSSSRTLSVNVDDNNSFLRASGPMLLQSGGAITTISLDASQNMALTGNLSTTGGAIFNEGGVDADFRVESDTNTHMLFVDAGNNRVHIGGSDVGDGELNVNDMIRISGVAPELRIDIGSAGYYLQLTEEYVFPKSIGHIRSVANTSYEGQLQFSANAGGGTYRELARMDYASGTVFNETSADIDFRVESDTNTHTLFVDAEYSRVGINTTFINSGTLQVQANANAQAITAKTATDGYSLFQGFNSSDGLVFQVTGSGSLTSNTASVFNENGDDFDFRVESNDNENMLFVDGGSNKVGIGRDPQDNGSTLQVAADATASTDLQLTLRGLSNENKKLVLGFDTTANIASITSLEAGVNYRPLHLQGIEFVWNEAGADHDFRVESDTNAHALFVDGGNNQVVIGSSTPITGSTNNIPLAVGYATGPAVRFYSNESASRIATLGISLTTYGADRYSGYQLAANGSGIWTTSSNANANYVTGGGGSGPIYLGNFSQDPFENSSVAFVEYANFNNTGIVFNETSLDRDFRVETNGADYAFFVDGSTNNIGIQTATEWAIVGGGNGTSSSGSSIDMGYDATIYGGSAYWAGGLDIGTNFWRDASGYHYKRTDRQATAYQQSSQGASHAFLAQINGDGGAVISWDNLLYMDRTQTIFNDSGLDIDFRVESDNTSAALFVDGSNGKVVLGGTTANADLYITKITAGEVVRADNSQNDWNGVMYYSVIFGSGNNNGSISADRHFQGYAGGAARFVVCGNGDVKNNNNSYGAISDLKLKENIVDSGSQWDDIKALRVRKYSMKDEYSDVPTQIGVIAQELEAAGMGGLVTESADLDVDNNDLGTTTKQVTYSVLYMKAVKALQEAMERIESLESRIAALES